MTTVITATAIVQLNAERSYGIYIYFYYVMKLYSRAARVVNEAQVRNILDIHKRAALGFWAVIVHTARRIISEFVLVWVSADPIYGVLSTRQLK